MTALQIWATTGVGWEALDARSQAARQGAARKAARKTALCHRRSLRSVPSPILRVRVARSDLEALDRRAAALGVRRSDVARSLIRAGLAADSSPAPDALVVEPLPADWRDVAARLQELAPERWGLPDPLDDLLGGGRLEP